MSHTHFIRHAHWPSTRRLMSTATTLFTGLQPYQIDISSLNPNPLLELQQACIARGIADAHGYRRPGAPWAFSLAEIQQHQHEDNGRNGMYYPSVRTIGFQRVSEHGLDWLTARKAPEAGSESEKKNRDSNDSQQNNIVQSHKVAISYAHGIYPPPPGESCEQWRAEGVTVELPVAEALATAPRASLAQILAVHQCRKEQMLRKEETNNNTTSSSRLELDDRQFFIQQVQRARERLDNNDLVDLQDLQSAIQFVRLMPNRMELLVNGQEIWERFEWHRNQEEWSEKVQLMPY